MGTCERGNMTLVGNSSLKALELPDKNVCGSQKALCHVRGSRKGDQHPVGAPQLVEPWPGLARHTNLNFSTT